MGKALIIAGCICLLISVYLYRQRYDTARLSITTYKKNLKVYKTKTASIPVSLKIPNLNVDLAIIPSRISNGGSWQTTTDGISYLISSPIPGDMGNSIFYGHNWPSLLGKLPKVKPGTIIEVHYADNTVKRFEVNTTAVVNPDQIGILDPTDDKRITIYTCTGFLDSKRFVAVALLQDI